MAARATAMPGAGWSDLWLGYAEAVAARERAGDARGCARAFDGRRRRGRADIRCSGPSALRLVSRGRAARRLGRADRVAPRRRSDLRRRRPGPHRRGLPIAAQAGRRARRRGGGADRALPAGLLGGRRHGPGGRGPRVSSASGSGTRRSRRACSCRPAPSRSTLPACSPSSTRPDRAALPGSP